MRVRQTIVHRFQTGPTRITGKSHLHRGRLVSKKKNPIAAHMQGEINQDVDAIVPNRFGHILIGNPCYVAPSVGVCLKLLGHRIGPNRIGIAEHLELIRVAMPHQRQYVPPHDMLTKVGRYQPDSQPPIRISVRIVPAAQRSQRRGVPIVPFRVLSSNQIRVRIRIKMQGVHQIAVNGGIPRLEFDGPRKSIDRSVNVARRLKRIAQGILHLGIIVVFPGDFTQHGYRFIQIAVQCQRLAKQNRGAQELRLKLNRPASRGNRERRPARAKSASAKLAKIKAPSGCNSVARLKQAIASSSNPNARSARPRLL